ncbi:hypothetical protein [Mycobacterium sp. 050134]|uniref:hypothetical protein n=1 Tax=Mycobacterium sp. 050134 TaxID=3096111 RepID=UPI002EDA591C
MTKVSAKTVGLTATALAVAAALTGCGGNKSAAPSTSRSASASTASASSSAASSSAAPTSGAAQPSDYSNLLIKATDIVVPGDTFTLAQSVPVPSPAGVDGLFMNQANSRKIDVTLYVYPDAGAAGQARDMAAQAMTDPEIGVKGGAPGPIDIGTNGTMVIGTANKHDGPVSKAMVMFVEGKVFADLEFESAPGDPVPQDFVLDVARKQDAAIKSGLPA